MGQKKRRRKWIIVTTHEADETAQVIRATRHTLRSDSPVTVMHTATRANQCLVCNGQGAVG